MTKEFKSLKASGLSDEFDAVGYGSEPIIQVEDGKNQIAITCIFPGFDLSDDDQDIAGEKKPFKEVGIKGVGFLSQEGKPLLPVFRRFVNIPPGCSVEFDVEKGRAANFEDILVTPSQESAVDTDEEHTFEFDEESYKKDEFFPKEMVKVSPAQDIDGYNAVLLEVCPIRYNAAKRKLQGYSNIRIILKFSGKDMDSDENEFLFTDPSSSREGFGNLLLNPSRALTRLEETPTLRVPGILYPWGPEFIIIYHNNFKTAAQKLALWKNTKGIST